MNKTGNSLASWKGSELIVDIKLGQSKAATNIDQRGIMAALNLFRATPSKTKNAMATTYFATPRGSAADTNKADSAHESN